MLDIRRKCRPCANRGVMSRHKINRTAAALRVPASGSSARWALEDVVTNKLDQYTDVINRLVSETVKCTPQEWTTGTLTIDCDGTRINYQLKNEEQSGAASISEKLRDLIDELYVRMAQQGDKWIEAALTFNLAGNEVNFKTDFKYAKSSEPSPIALEKPWWKVW